MNGFDGRLSSLCKSWFLQDFRRCWSKWKREFEERRRQNYIVNANFRTRLFRTVPHHLFQERESKCFVCSLGWVLLAGVGLALVVSLVCCWPPIPYLVGSNSFPRYKPNFTVNSVCARHCFFAIVRLASNGKRPSSNHSTNCFKYSAHIHSKLSLVWNDIFVCLDDC